MKGLNKGGGGMKEYNKKLPLGAGRSDRPTRAAVISQCGVGGIISFGPQLDILDGERGWARVQQANRCEMIGSLRPASLCRTH